MTIPRRSLVLLAFDPACQPSPYGAAVPAAFLITNNP